MARTDYFADPDAPKANSIVVATTGFVLDGQDRVLLIRRSDNGLWALPGGAQEFGESVSECAVRETLEETGLVIEIVGLVGIYSNPQHVVAFTNGEVRQQFSICLRGRPVGGELQTSSESRPGVRAYRADGLRWSWPLDSEQVQAHRNSGLRCGMGDVYGDGVGGGCRDFGGCGCGGWHYFAD